MSFLLTIVARLLVKRIITGSYEGFQSIQIKTNGKNKKTEFVREKRRKDLRLDIPVYGLGE